jgi:hypothetical protein
MRREPPALSETEDKTRSHPLYANLPQFPAVRTVMKIGAR